VKAWGPHNAWRARPSRESARTPRSLRRGRRAAAGLCPSKQQTSDPCKRQRMSTGYAPTKGFH